MGPTGSQSQAEKFPLLITSSPESNLQRGTLFRTIKLGRVCTNNDTLYLACSSPLFKQSEMSSIQEIELREQDRWLPIANVARLMKGTLPATAKVSKDAKECMQECVSEFISFITSEASDKCLNEKRKTINGEDILYSMASLGFENYAEVLKIYLAKYREQQALRQERGDLRRRPVPTIDSNGGSLKTPAQDFFDFAADKKNDTSINNTQDPDEDTVNYDNEHHSKNTTDHLDQDGYPSHYENDDNERNQDHNDDNHHSNENSGHHDNNEVQFSVPTFDGYDEQARAAPNSMVHTHAEDIEHLNERLVKQENVDPNVHHDAALGLNLNDNANAIASESEDIALVANGHHGENVLYRYQNDF